MILAIDMGNSNIVVGGIDETRTYFEERITTDDRKTSLEYAIMFKNILEIHRVKRGDIEGAILSSVVPPLNAPVSSAVKKIIGKRPLLVGSGMKTGLNIKMDNPKTVGGDRIVAAVAAIAKYKSPVIVIDMGTATTLDVVDNNGCYIGGVILPGINVALNSLVSNTAQLPRINLDVPKRVIGKNTIECMRNGIMYGNAASLDGLIDRMEQELGAPATLVATGGMARFITPLCRHEIAYVPDLLLSGLLILYRQNTGEGA
ncbi:MAG: type III pantothenate kinase [Lachnospiraceae bacterium]|nr:type III pantothenate kinase [Lachnospiraceae bacterium]